MAGPLVTTPPLTTIPSRFALPSLPPLGAQSYVPPVSGSTSKPETTGRSPSTTPTHDEAAKHKNGWPLVLAYGVTGAGAGFTLWRAEDYLANLSGPSEPIMLMGMVPLGPVPLPLPPIPPYRLTEKQRLPLAITTVSSGAIDMATDLAKAYHPNPNYAFSGFAVILFEPTLDAIADAQRTRQALAYSIYVGDSEADKSLKGMFLTYYILRQLTDAELTQPITSQSADATSDCEWKANCGVSKEIRMLDASFQTADAVNDGMRGVDTFLAATGEQGLFLKDGQPTGGNLAAAIAVPTVALFLRHDDGEAWDLAGRDGAYFLRDLAFQGGGFLLAYATHDDPKTQFRLTTVIPTVLMAFKTPQATSVLYHTENSGNDDDMFYQGDNVLYGYQNTAAGIASANALFDKDKSWAARLVPGAIALVGVTATTIGMADLGVQAREEQYRADDNPLNAMDPKTVGVVCFLGGFGVTSLVDFVAQKVRAPTNNPANTKTQAWNGKPTDFKFDLAPVAIPTATGGSTTGLQAQVGFRF